MQFIKTGEVFKAVRITGPTHNLLGLSFYGLDEEGAVTVEPMQHGESTQSETLDGNEIRRHVLEGVDRADSRLGSKHCVRVIQFVASDSADLDAYSLLAERIVERVERGGEYDGNE
ncbi:MAG: hypothetical protein HQ582_00910 [Planctomycetes bacterium]|nr:hypothetical protein [Planctomycetota bacterium]